MDIKIAVYEGLEELVPRHFSGEEGVDDWTPGEHLENINLQHPERMEGLEIGKRYTFRDKYEMECGSFVKHKYFKSMISLFANGNEFMEFIRFPDSKGVLGTEVCKKLYKDFESRQEDAEWFAADIESSWWISMYNDWLLAFETASKKGAIEFI